MNILNFKCFRNLAKTTYIKSICYQSMSTKYEIRQELMKILDVSAVQMTFILQKHTKLQKLDVAHIKFSHEILKRFGVKADEIVESPLILTMSPIVLENRGMLLEECGITHISVNLLLRYLAIMKKRVSLLLSYGIIDDEMDIRKSLYSYLEEPPSNVPAMPDLDTSASLYETYMSVLNHYLKWRLEITDPAVFTHISKTYHRVRHKSFRNMKDTFKILENDLKFSIERIRNHAYVLHSSPHNTKRILKEIPEIGGVPIKEALYKHPKIIMTNVETVVKTTSILKQHNISNEAIRKCMEIFTLSSDSVLKRIEAINDTPEFKVLSENTRILKLVHHQRKAKSRLMYLQKINMRNASLDILATTDARFERFVTEGIDRTRGDDLINYLADRLKLSKRSTRTALLKHQYWFNVPLLQASETITYLLENNYSTHEIIGCIHLVLYPKFKVVANLQFIREHSELSKQNLTRIQTLNLCLYYIEQPHHFTGDGIWTTDPQLTEPTNANNVM